jgi:hypothetical protein
MAKQTPAEKIIASERKTIELKRLRTNCLKNAPKKLEAARKAPTYISRNESKLSNCPKGMLKLFSNTALESMRLMSDEVRVTGGDSSAA